MLTSAAWLNEYLDPPAAPGEQAELLTRAGFPLEGAEEVALSGGTDVRQDFELTSNRGDCACHLGLAREIAAMSGRSLRIPEAAPQASGPPARQIVTVTDERHDLCPLYTARIIRGLKVGPSPQWLKDRLTARGDIPRNNVVDATNFVLFEWGQPTHVFDLRKLAGPEIIIRTARPGETILPIGEGAAEVKLAASDLVIADAERPVAIAGVKGGAMSAVTDETVDILIEAATFDPVSVRHTARRLGIVSDAGFRFERGVHPGQVDPAADRLAELILEVAGGEMSEGAVADGAPIPERRTVSMRPERCRQLLGVPVSDQEMADGLARLGFEPVMEDSVIRCTVPHPRLDIDREVDLIEEVGRIYGHDRIPIAETIPVRVAAPQPRVMAKRAVSDALVGMGYVEAVTHSLISEQIARAFLPPGAAPGAGLLRVDDERARAEPALRPSLLPSLLRVFALNRDNGVRDVKLFETAATFTAGSHSRHNEHVSLAFLHPAQSPERGVREVRGVIDRLVSLILGPDATVDVRTSDAAAWLAPGAAARLNGEVLGHLGVISRQVAEMFDIAEPLYAAEIALPAHYDRYPPETEARALPAFPAIERDVSAVIDEAVAWAEVHQCVAALGLEHLEAVEFVTTFRGKQIGAGRKSLTLRLRFRAPDRTLRHEDADAQMGRVMAELEGAFSATIRR